MSKSIAEILRLYRPNVGIVLFNRQAQVWIGERAPDVAEPGQRKDSHRWQFPQGGIDEGEDVQLAAFRELKEETAVTSAQLLLITPGWLTYDFPSDHKRFEWKGQRQKWAAMLFTGTDEEIDIAADTHQEFANWRWAELEEAPEIIVPFKRDVYAQITTSLTPLRDYLRASD